MSSELPLPSSFPSHANRVSRSPSGRRRWSTAHKRAFLGQFEASGLSAAQFCREQGLSEVTFSGWRRKLAKTDANPAGSSVPFARVRVLASAGAPDGTEAMVRIETPGDWRLTVPVGCDPAWVAHLVGLWPKG